MKKNVYFWIFIGVAVVVCGMLLVAANNLSNQKIGENSFINRAKVQKVDKDNQVVESEAVDLTQEDIDFEDDADDLADGLIDDAQFDEVADFEAVENEVY